jgi:hypothetical protein
MARTKRNANADAGKRDSDGDFNPKTRSPTKRKSTSPQKKSAAPRRSRKSEQQATVDEGIAASPDDATQQAQVDPADSAYASSPPKATATGTPLRTPLRKGAARGTRSRKANQDEEAEAATGEVAEPAEDATPSKVVALKVPQHRVRDVLEQHALPKKVVTFHIPPAKLEEEQQRQSGQSHFEQPLGEAEQAREGTTVETQHLEAPLRQEQSSAPEETAEMAPVRENEGHKVLDGGSSQNDDRAIYAYRECKDALKDVVQSFFEMGSTVHGYLPESHDPLVNQK